MARITIELPNSFSFSALVPVRVTDLNYGGHVGNDTILSFIHEARAQYLRQFGYDEKNLAGTSLIMSDVSIAFKNEAFYGDTLHVSVAVTGISRAAFDMVYLLEKEANGKMIAIAEAKTGMVCFDYSKRKITSLPEEVKKKFETQ
jgi:YbgC/YbaW family acyl-CoA thioester hydrolase